MATVHKEIAIEAPADDVWDAVRDVGTAHVRLFPGVLKDARLEDGARVVTFANGLVLRELIVSLDDDGRRFVYAAVGGRTSHHNASLQVLSDGPGRCRVIWILDFLPEQMKETVAGLVEAGAAAMKRTLEARR